MQVVVRPENKYYSIAENLKNEYVIKVTGKIVERESKNSKIETGEIEVETVTLELINVSKEIPFIYAISCVDAINFIFTDSLTLFTKDLI